MRGVTVHPCFTRRKTSEDVYILFTIFIIDAAGWEVAFYVIEIDHKSIRFYCDVNFFEFKFSRHHECFDNDMKIRKSS